VGVCVVLVWDLGRMVVQGLCFVWLDWCGVYVGDVSVRELLV